jgi:hypothetical protein
MIRDGSRTDRSAWRRCALPAALVTLLIAASACGGDDRAEDAAPATPSPTPAASTASLTGGTTTLNLDASTWRVLELAGVKLRAAGDADGRGATLRFPITGGQLELAPTGGAINHAGALRFTARGERVRASDLIVDPAHNVVTGVVRGKRIPLLVLDMELPAELPPAGEEITIEGRITAFGSSAVVALGSALEVEELADGLPLGSIMIEART